MKASSGIMLTLLLIGTLTLVFNIQPAKAEPTTIVVPDDYPTIQEAIDNANEGDTVRVRAGTYSEQITINKDRLKILGESWETTVVDLLSTGRVDVFRIVANDIRLSGFTIQNGNDAVIIDDSSNINITNIMIANNSGGIFVDNSTEIILEENIITSNSLTGVQVTNSYRCILRNNEITWHTKGLRLSYVQNSILFNNSILNNGGGIRLYKVNNTGISNNEILAPGKGVDSDNSSNNTIVENTFSNSYRAIQLAYHSDNNMIYHNNFQDNANDVYLSGSYYNSWDNGYPSGGNYWSDYTERYPDAEELDGSGIWDTPYVIDADNRDNYPLVEPWTPTPPVITATVDIDPDTLNLKSKGRWITAYIELQEGYDVNDIDVSSIMLNGTIPVDVEAPTTIGDYDEDGVPDLMVKFDRAEVMALLSVGEATLTVTGKVNNTPFEGSDTIRVINR